MRITTENAARYVGREFLRDTLHPDRIKIIRFPDGKYGFKRLDPRYDGICSPVPEPNDSFNRLEVIDGHGKGDT